MRFWPVYSSHIFNIVTRSGPPTPTKPGQDHCVGAGVGMGVGLAGSGVGAGVGMGVGVGLGGTGVG